MQSSASCTSLALKLTAGKHVSAGVPNAVSRIEVGTPTFRHVTLALTAAGFSTFTVLYCVQPFLPVLKDTFHVSPAESGLALPLCTGLLAVSLETPMASPAASAAPSSSHRARSSLPITLGAKIASGVWAWVQTMIGSATARSRHPVAIRSI